MDVRQLQSFVAVAEERHFGHAATRLHVSQPSLTQRIQQLEESLGAKLLDRTTRRVDLTVIGELLYSRASVLLGEFDALAEDVREVGNGARGLLRLGCVGTAAYRVVPQIMASAQAVLPGLQVQVQSEMLTPQIEQAFGEHRLDVAFLRPPVYSADLSLRPFLRERFVVAAPPDSAFAHRHQGSETVGFNAVVDESLIGYPRQSVVTGIVSQHAQERGFRPRVVHRMAETSTVLAFVAAGLGIAIVPESARSAAHARLSFFDIEDSPVIDLSVAWRTADRSRLVASFLELAEAFREDATRPSDPLPPADTSWSTTA